MQLFYVRFDDSSTDLHPVEVLDWVEILDQFLIQLCIDFILQISCQVQSYWGDATFNRSDKIPSLTSYWVGITTDAV